MSITTKAIPVNINAKGRISGATPAIRPPSMVNAMGMLAKRPMYF